MKKTVFAIALGATFVGAAPASQGAPALALLSSQVAAEPVKSAAPSATLHVAPSKPPVPALKYSLTVSAADQKPGNAAVLLNRAVIIAYQGGAQTAESRKFNEELAKTLAKPLDELRAMEKRGELADLRKRFRSRTDNALFEVRRAARLRDCDFLLPIGDGKRFVEILLPEVQECRMFGNWLGAQAKLDLLRGDFAAAERTMQAEMALGRHLGRQNLLISCLVAGRIEANVYEGVEQWVQTPASPNLYWALANVPSLWIDYGPALEMERNLLPQSLPGYDPNRPPAIGDRWWKEAFVQLATDLPMLADGDSQVQAPGGAALAVVMGFPRSRSGLLKNGWKPEDLEKMTPEEVVMRYSMETYREIADDLFKQTRLPYAIVGGDLKAFEERLQKLSEEREAIPLARMVLPALARVTFSEKKVVRQREMLRLVELLRWSAAEKGEWPTSLEGLPAPVPLDPVTGKPFEFARDGNKITLDAPLLPFMNAASQGQRYVLLLSEAPSKEAEKKPDAGK